MVRKKIDNRIRILIENGVAQGRRSMFVVVGDKARDQVVLLHHMLSKATLGAWSTPGMQNMVLRPLILEI